MSSKYIEKVIRAAQRTWEEIADDCLVDEDGLPDMGASLARSEVIELVSDADRMATLGGLSKDDMKRFHSLNRHERDSIMKETFPFKRYGW